MDCLHDGRRLPMDEETKCPECDGAGHFIKIYYVTRDMAIDAGDPSMEGTHKSEEVQCMTCNGTGHQQPDDAIPF